MANKENLKPFKKGTSGNPGGRPKTKFITDWLKHPDREKDMVKMRQIVDDDSMLYLEILIDFISGQEDIKNIISGVFSSEKKI